MGGFIALVCLVLAGSELSIQAQTSINVADYGAVGDAVQFYVNTVSNSMVVTTTNELSTGAIGDAIEISQAGIPTYGKNSSGVVTYGNQDLIATIANIVNGTNIYLSVAAQATLTSTFATYGHDNSANFQSALAAVAAYSNAVVNIPPGTFLCLTHTNYYTHGNGLLFAGILLTNGGFTLSGSGTNTILLGQGFWTYRNVVNHNGQTNSCFYRGFLLAISTPISRDYPVTIENLTLDGGVQDGYISNQNYPANIVDGIGWDGSHDALCVVGGTGNTFTHQLWTNVVFQHWRGEMVKSCDGSTNGNATFVNCLFYDGNATAINYYPSLVVTNNLFDNLFQIAEFYQAYNTNTGYFVDNITTNIIGNGFAFNGGKGINPPFIVRSNLFYTTGGNVIETTPGDNLSIIGNQIIACNAIRNIVGIYIGCMGYQGTFDNSNILVAANNFVGAYMAIQVGGANSTSANRAESVEICSNTINGGTVILDASWTTNVTFHHNVAGGGNGGGIIAGSGGAQYILIQTNNLYWTRIRDTHGSGITNYIDYSSGNRWQIWYAILPHTAYALVDTDASLIPPGAQMIISNGAYGAPSIPLYLDSALTVGPISVATGQTIVLNWNGSAWVTNGTPSGAPAITVAPASLPFGSILSGTSATNSFTVQNTGGGILSGEATVPAPFSIVSGADYSLGSNEIQTVTVVFSPTAVGSYSQTVTFTGGGGASATVTGSATNAPVPSAMIQVAPASIAYGTTRTGTSLTNSFTVQNVGTTNLSGAVTVAAPFRVLAGGSYNLAVNQSQTVSVIFSPTTAGTYSQSINFSGGGGTNATVTGTAINPPSTPPTLTGISANVTNLGTNPAVLEVAPGTPVTLSASASAPNNDSMSWQWLESTSGGTPVVYALGTGTSPTVSYTNGVSMGGSTFIWTLQVTDSATGLSAQAQLTNFMQLPAPLGLRVLSF